MTHTEAMKQALDVLLTLDSDLIVEVTKLNVAIDTLDAAIAIAEAEKQEPVAERFEAMHADGNVWITTLAAAALVRNTHPQPKREPLTDEQRDHIASLRGSYSAAGGVWIFTPKELSELFEAIEAAHGIKGKHEVQRTLGTNVPTM